MTTLRRFTSTGRCRAVLLIALALTLPPAVAADMDPPRMDRGDTDHDSMPGMDHGDTSRVDMDHGDMDHGSSADTDHSSMSHATMPPMQGGSAAPDARSGDYSDGIAGSPAHALHMHGSRPVGMVLLDQLEGFDGQDGDGTAWEGEAWYGTDGDKLWLRSEGERRGGSVEDGDAEAFWNHSVAPFWSTQLGARYDFGEGPDRRWAAFGIQGLAPYWFELEATAYVGANGRTTARLRAEYELLLTQRLILQPEAEVNVYGEDDAARRIGSGVSDVQFGLRLRYEIRRQFAPYVGVSWTRRVGDTADYARQDGEAVSNRQFVAGVRIWF